MFRWRTKLVLLVLALCFSMCSAVYGQNPAVVSPFPKFRALDANGVPLSGGKLFTYAAGTVSTNKATYTTAAGTTPNANPVILDSAGYADVWLIGTYKFVLKDASDVTIWTVDNIAGTAPQIQTEVVACVDNATTDSARLNAAITTLTAARGGIVWFTPGICNINTAIVLNANNKSLIFQGSGSSEAGQNNAATVLKWTGGASTFFKVDTDARNVSFRDLDFENTGSVTIFIHIGFTDQTRISNVNMRPTTFPSTAAILIGDGAFRAENTFMDHVTIRGVTSTNTCLKLDRVQDFRAIRINTVTCKNYLGIIGSADTANFGCSQCSFNNAPNADIWTIYQARSANFTDCHFENDGTGYAITVPATAGETRPINIVGGYIAANSGGNATPYIFNNDNSGTEWSIINTYVVQAANPYYLMRNSTAAAQLTLIHNVLTGTGAGLTTAYTGDVFATGNRCDNVPCLAKMGNTGTSGTDIVGSVNGTGGLTTGQFEASAFRKTTYDGTTTPDVKGSTYMVLSPGAPITITNLLNGVEGQKIHFHCNNGNATINRANTRICGGVNFVCTAEYGITFIKTSSTWNDLSCLNPS